MPFERFTQTGRGYVPRAAIWRRGQISLNQGAVQRFRLTQFTYAILFYDCDTKQIGIRFTNDTNEPGATKFTLGKTGALISAKSFLDYYEIDYTASRKYDIAYDQNNDMYIIKLEDKPPEMENASTDSVV